MPVDPSTNAQLAWDAENRLISVTVTVNGTTTTYGYDHQHRRIRKTSGATVTRYIYDDWNIIAEYTGTSLSKSYTWGMDLSGSMQGAGGVGGLLAVHQHSTDPNNNSPITINYYPTCDGNGNVSEYLDALGVPQAHYEYDAFGNTTVSTGAKAADFAHRFSTKPQDAETALYYYAYRYYDPKTGRWPSRDPIEENGGYNLYTFSYNSPLNYIDVSGLKNYMLGSDDPAYTADAGAGAHGSIPATFKGHLLQRIARGGAYGAGL